MINRKLAVSAIASLILGCGLAGCSSEKQSATNTPSPSVSASAVASASPTATKPPSPVSQLTPGITGRELGYLKGHDIDTSSQEAADAIVSARALCDKATNMDEASLVAFLKAQPEAERTQSVEILESVCSNAGRFNKAIAEASA